MTGERTVSGQKLDELNGSRVTAMKVMEHKNQGSSLSQFKEDFTQSLMELDAAAATRER